MKTIFNPTTGEFDYVGEDSVKVNHIDNAGVQQGNLDMEPNNRYVFSSPVGLLVLSFQDVSETGRAYVYELDFVTGDNASIKTPATVSWVKTPVFNPGKRYLISIDISVVGGEKQIIGMYLEMEA
jgi:hypothetical protein